MLLLIVAVYGCSVYANLSFAVKHPTDYRFFPPFQRNVNVNSNSMLGAEYFQIAESLSAGKGFANPFREPTGPTAWMPPVLPAVLAGLLRLCHGSRNGVMWVVVFLKATILVGTGWLVLALVRRTSPRVRPGLVAGAFLLALLSQFRLCFQHTSDDWLVLLAVDLLVAGLCWLPVLGGWRAAGAWGLFGGLCALTSPAVGLCWGALSCLVARRQRALYRLAFAVLVAGLTLTPWTVRNYLVFRRLIPVKSNLVYELYQSQCLQPDGLLERTTFRAHPNGGANKERQEYKALGESTFLERKWRQFCQAVAADPMDFPDRLASRFLGATLWYVPFDRAGEARRPAVLWASRALHPLPFLAVLVLALGAFFKPLSWAQWAVIWLYLIYLLPYIVVSYYERYTVVPLLGVKVLLVIWAAERLLSSLTLWGAPPGRGQRPGEETG